MTIEFDFEAPEVFAKAAGIAGNNDTGSSTTICTIPLASADFPLQSGRGVYVEADFVCLDSNGVALAAWQTAAVSLGSLNIRSNGNANQGGTPIGIPYLTLNGSNDLVVSWGNENTTASGITHDVSVRVKLRWFGS